MIFISWIFRDESKHLIFNVFWWEHVWFNLLFYLELYQFLFLLLKTLIRWMNLGLQFSLKVIFIICMLRDESKHFILNGYLWKLYRFIMVFPIKLYQFYFFKNKLWYDLSRKFASRFLVSLRLELVDLKTFMMLLWMELPVFLRPDFVI